MAVHSPNAAGLLTVCSCAVGPVVRVSKREGSALLTTPALGMGWGKAGGVDMDASWACEVRAAGGWGRARWALPTDVFPEWSSLFRVWGFNWRFLTGPHDVQDGYSLLGREGTVC